MDSNSPRGLYRTSYALSANTRGKGDTFRAGKCIPGLAFALFHLTTKPPGMHAQKEQITL